MRAIAFSEIINGVADAMGWDPDNLDAREWHAIKRAASRAIGEIWQSAEFPDIRENELRRFTPDYVSSEDVSAGEVRYFPPTGAYYQALRDTTGNDPAELTGNDWDTNLDYWAEAVRNLEADVWDSSEQYEQGDVVRYGSEFLFYQVHTEPPIGTLPTDTDYWGEVTELDPVIEWTSAGQMAIGRVLGVYDRNPDRDRGARSVDWTESVSGIQITDASINEAWVVYLRRPPRFVGDFWDSTVGYSAATDEDAVTIGGTGINRQLAFYEDVADFETRSIPDQVAAVHLRRDSANNPNWFTRGDGTESLTGLVYGTDYITNDGKHWFLG